ncbi:MAG: hypothetical protein HQK77_04950 [Desulfobacterales bacterium]|nr:hypothetical protein [Desulfobacterales bacterium]
MKYGFRFRRLGRLVFVWMVALTVMTNVSVFAETNHDQDKNLPDRLISMGVEYPGVIIQTGDDFDMNINFYNKGRSNEVVKVWIDQVPEGWKAKLKTYRYDITRLHVPSDDSKMITFEAEPNKESKPGDYTVSIKAETEDGEFKMSQDVWITIKEKLEEKKESKGVKLTTSYPVLRGPSDGKFEFSVEVESKLEKDAVFELFATGPEGWDINFKPAYETKFISSLRIKEKQNTTVAVEVKPAIGAKAGEYPIPMRVSSEDANAEATLTVILTGTYDFEVGTPTGLLSLDARQGLPANMSIYIKNTGSAPSTDIKFMSFKPENWKIEFKPEQIDVIEPGNLKQVEVVITPNEDALVGDYSVNVRVEGEKTNKSIEFRVTVKASSAWAWVGIGIIVLVIGSLTLLFRKLGRR